MFESAYLAVVEYQMREALAAETSRKAVHRREFELMQAKTERTGRSPVQFLRDGAIRVRAALTIGSAAGTKAVASR